MKKSLIALIIIISSVCFLYRDFIFKNKTFNPNDIRQYVNMANVAKVYKEANPSVDEVLWNPNSFAGMPNFAISYNGKVNFFDTTINRVLAFFKEGSVIYTFIFGLLLFWAIYLLTASIEIATVLAIIGMFLPNYVSLYDAGHNSKGFTSVLFVGLLISFIKTIEKKSWWWGLIFSLFTAFSFRTSHPQIIYYGLLSLSGYGAYYLFNKKLEHSVLDKAKVASYFIAGIVLALGLYALTFLPVKEYMNETIRGGGVSSSSGESGLSHAYANGWSFHPMELLTLLNPHYFGLKDTEYGIGALYWGWMSFTSTSFYMGVMIIPFAILGIKEEWKNTTGRGLILSMIIALFIAFGEFNIIPGLNSFMLDYIPYYNKFRSPNVSMAFVQVILFIFAAYGFRQFFSNTEQVLKSFYYILLACLAILILSLLGETMWSFTKTGEAERYAQQLSSLVTLRKEMYQSSMFASIGYLIVTFGLVYAYSNKKINSIIVLLMILFFTGFDLYKIDSGYLKTAVTKSNFTGQFGVKSETEEFLLTDKSQFRVFPVGQLFDDAKWSYYFENFGGYSAAKLSLYQTIIEKAGFQGFPNLAVISMLNAKYLLIQVKNQEELNQLVSQAPQMGLIYRHLDRKTGVVTLENPNKLERVWLSTKIEQVGNEIEQLNKVVASGYNPKDITYVNKLTNIPDQATEFSYEKISYDVHTQIYKIKQNKTSLVNFGEVYYPKGWHVSIDGKESEILQSNFITRSVIVPEGEHEVKFTFLPPIYIESKIISEASSYIYYILILLALFLNRNKIILYFKEIKF